TCSLASITCHLAPASWAVAPNVRIPWSLSSSQPCDGKPKSYVVLGALSRLRPLDCTRLLAPGSCGPAVRPITTPERARNHVPRSQKRNRMTVSSSRPERPGRPVDGDLGFGGA